MGAYLVAITMLMFCGLTAFTVTRVVRGLERSEELAEKRLRVAARVGSDLAA